MELLLIRHGSTEPISPENYNAGKRRPDPPLDNVGRSQAERLGRRLAGAGLQKIYASDLLRTIETAEILNSYLNVPLEARPELREIDMGTLHSRTWSQVRQEDPDYHDRWHRHTEDLPYPCGESGGQAALRTMRVLKEIAEGDHQKAAVVVHGGIIRVALCAVLGLGQEKRFLFGPPENTSITVLCYDRERKEFSVYSVNDAGHLL